MERQAKHSQTRQHDVVRQKYDEVQSDGRYEEGMAQMALYHRHCQDPVIFRTLGDIRGKSLLDLACGDGFYTRRIRTECAANPVMGKDDGCDDQNVNRGRDHPPTIGPRGIDVPADVAVR